MKIQWKTILYCMAYLVLLSACSQTGAAAVALINTPDASAEIALDNTATPDMAEIQAADQATPTSFPIMALSPRLTSHSSAEEIREKMLTSFLNWDTLEMEAISSYYSLNPDDSVAYVISLNVHSWIDQPSLRFRTEQEQPETDAIPKLAISDGILSVSREGTRIITGYPEVPGSTYVHAIGEMPTEADAITQLRAGEAIFPPMGEVYNGSLNSALFPSSYAVQNPGNYQAVVLESIAGRETLKVTYDDADRWGRTSIHSVLWIDTETGLVLKTYRESSQDHFKRESEITRIVYNPVLEASLFNTDDAMPDLGLQEMQSQTIADTTIYAADAVVSGENVSIKVCFELPSTADWMLFDMQMNNSTNMNGLQGYLYYLEPAGTRQTKGLRCDVLTFSISAEQEQVHLQIGKLYASAREGTYCDYVEEVTQILDERGSGIQFTCLEDHGMTTIEISEKPAGMSEEVAHSKVSELLFQFNNTDLPGPWVFTLPIVK